jgi:hypothetical protein
MGVTFPGPTTMPSVVAFKEIQVKSRESGTDKTRQVVACNCAISYLQDISKPEKEIYACNNSLIWGSVRDT